MTFPDLRSPPYDVTICYFLFNPRSPVSQFAIFYSIPFPLCHSLKSEKLWHETEDFFVCMAA